MLIDVYDFDGTIYDGDSTVDFIAWCVRRHPKILRHVPKIALLGIRLAVKNIGLTQFKSALFSMMAKDFSLTDEAAAFWADLNTRKNLGPWFFDTPRDLPVVIASASPEFELKHAAKILGVDTLIGTRCNEQTGMLTGKNCKGEEKIRRIREAVGDFQVRAMYTDDAKADGPLLAIAEEKYIVTHGRVRRIAD